MKRERGKGLKGGGGVGLKGGRITRDYYRTLIKGSTHTNFSVAFSLLFQVLPGRCGLALLPPDDQRAGGGRGGGGGHRGGEPAGPGDGGGGDDAGGGGGPSAGNDRRRDIHRSRCHHRGRDPYLCSDRVSAPTATTADAAADAAAAAAACRRGRCGTAGLLLGAADPATGCAATALFNPTTTTAASRSVSSTGSRRRRPSTGILPPARRRRGRGRTRLLFILVFLVLHTLFSDHFLLQLILVTVQQPRRPRRPQAARLLLPILCHL